MSADGTDRDRSTGRWTHVCRNRLPDRLPPQNREAERCVLGSMLRDNDVIGDVVQIIRTERLLRRRPSENLPGDRRPVRPRAIPSIWSSWPRSCNEQKHIEDVGGYGYLAELWDAAPTAANAEYYARIVRDKAMVRNLIHASTEILRDAYDQAMPADELLEAAERKILDIAEKGITGQTCHARTRRSTRPTTASTRGTQATRWRSAACRPASRPRRDDGRACRTRS